MVKEEEKKRHKDLILKTIHHLEKLGHTKVKADIEKDTKVLLRLK